MTIHPFGGSHLILTYPLPPHAPSFVYATTPPTTPPPKAPPMIDITKQYQTRDGREVRIYATDGGGVHPVHGARLSGKIWEGMSWSAAGWWSICGGASNDLVEKPKTIRVDCWLNVFADGTRRMYDSRALADDAADWVALRAGDAGLGRVACVPFQRDVTVGEGL